MLLTKKLACPSCNVKLRVADSLPRRQNDVRVRNARKEFPVPSADGLDPAPEAKARRRKPARLLTKMRIKTTNR